MLKTKKIVVPLLLLTMAFNIFGGIVLAMGNQNQLPHEDNCCSKEGSHEHKASLDLPKGSFKWHREAFEAWFKSSNRSNKAVSKLIEKSDQAYSVLLFDSVDSFNKWVDTLSPGTAAAVKKQAMVVKGSELPNTLKLDSGSGSFEIATSDTDEYVILATPTRWCYICKKVVEGIFWYLLGRYLFDPTVRRLELWFEERFECWQGHDNYVQDDVDYTKCPYLPWCMGTWQDVIDGIGDSIVDCICECGAHWTYYK